MNDLPSFEDLRHVDYGTQEDRTRIWVNVAADLIQIDRANAQRLRDGLRTMGDLMNAIKPAYERDEIVGGVRHEDLNGVMDPIDPLLQDDWIGITGSIMLGAMDGPKAIVVSLVEAVDGLERRMYGDARDSA